MDFKLVRYNSKKNKKKKIFKYLKQNYKKYLIKLIIISSIILIYKLLCKYTFFNNLKFFFAPNTYRIAVVFGTRPEAIKLIPLIKELKENKNFLCITINTGQHKEMIQQILKTFNMESSIDFNLKIMQKNQSLAKLTSKTISQLEKIYNLINPNAVIIQGDTTTGFAAAISAFYQKIPIFHVEAGLRTNNLYFPFPEEFNRVTIDDISSLYFAPTDWAASNLLKENKISSNIFVTGNTVVDVLQLTLNNTSPSAKLKKLIEKAKSLCMIESDCKIILLTCHRRENYFKPIYNILTAIQNLLKDFNDIVIIFPFHLNPNIKQSIINAIPSIVYDDIISGKKITNDNYLYLNRFLIIPPLNYIDSIHLESASYFIMTDSGGIQEEGVSIGKPVLILRENTERPEAVISGSAVLAGTSYDKIYNFASSLLKNKVLYDKMAKVQNIYGKGNTSIIISEIIQNYFQNKSQNLDEINKLNYSLILSQYDNSIYQSKYSIFNVYQEEQYDIVIVLTVWKRNNLERQLLQIKDQSILKNKKTNIIVFQNSNYVNVSDIINKWNKSEMFSEKVVINFIQSTIETGYFGRFIIPLTSSVRGDSYFLICDDDVIWGKRYFENMFRVVDEGSLATRNGRLLDENFQEYSPVPKKAIKKNIHVCYDEDIQYDFGGHTWAGFISWLRKAWNHIPISIENSEDFWLSATLKSFYNIPTKTPKCPCPSGGIPIVPDMCASSDISSIQHTNAKIGNSIISHNIRNIIMKETSNKFNYTRLIKSNLEYVKNISKKFIFGKSLFNLSDLRWNDVFLWQ
jgi:UDP-N-acetylglucosamine 2-epimerase (non-hydrolysing)